MIPNVISTIVKNDLCIGCGVCASICPDHSLEMEFNHFGEYNPIEEKECVKECGLCLKVCPFADGNDNEDSIGKSLFGCIPDISHHPETGYYLDCFVGYARETRECGSSGGIATWLLSNLLKKGIVDYVIAVVPNKDPEKLFKYAILPDPKSVQDSAGSAYYPVELSEVLRKIQENSGKCAIIGLPCYIKALKLASQKNKKLKEKISVTVGLVCGQLKSKHYTDYISSLSGVCPPLQNVYYRGKSKEEPAYNYYFSCMNKKGNAGKIFFDEGVAVAWTNRWFTQNACNYCDDVFAECADVTLMDAWLPEYFTDYRGMNLILVRSTIVKEIFNDGIKTNKIFIKSVQVQDLIRSQEGVIQIKKEHLAYRLFLDQQKKIQSPIKRIAPKNIWWNPFLRIEVELKEHMRVISRNLWAEKNCSGCNIEEMLNKSMYPLLNQLKMGKKISNFFNFPMTALQFMQRKLWRHSHGR